MGLLADIFIASLEVAKKLDDTSSLPQEDVAQYGRMTELEMGFIKQLLIGEELSFDPNLGFEAINIVDDGERVTTMFPNDMITMLANMNDEQMTHVANGLAESEEMQCDPSDVMPVLIDLKKLAAKAEEFGQGLFLWNCL
ncbi:MAG: hypothetical protein HRT89_05045 [Lentisphaeria bacterium]|nr:hypothetical protein [Lentisphaeria bacterium]NQZ67416.1 hypothetical protein [Lentisphaeria bacterium]